MNTNKIMYWLALGVFALGLHSEYRNGRFLTVHRLADHAESTLCRMVTRAEQTVVLARALTSDHAAAADELMASAREAEAAQAELLRDHARMQAELLRDQVRAQADLMRAQAELQRSQIEQIRWRTRAKITRTQFKFTDAASRRITLVCPKTGARISVEAAPPDVEVSDSF